jgi:pSer/pThr/pTyr-binding forkhead associated (FHA) protein
MLTLMRVSSGSPRPDRAGVNALWVERSPFRGRAGLASKMPRDAVRPNLRTLVASSTSSPFPHREHRVSNGMPELVVTLKGRELQRVPIVKTDTAIGRDPSSEVLIENVGVSRTHAVVRYRDGIFRVHDHGSSNGLFVNGAPIGQGGVRPLQDGDEIQVGKFVVVFSTRSWGRPSEETTPVFDDNSDRTDLDDTRRRSLADATTHLSASDIAKLSLSPPPPEVREPAIERIRVVEAPPRRTGLIVFLVTALSVAVIAIGVLVWMLSARL